VRTHDFEEIRPEFMARVETMVWCSAATVDRQGRPRSRVLHPIWEGEVAWITADPRSPKGRDLEQAPYMSLAYVSDVFNPAYVECHATWVTDRATKQHVWDLLLRTPVPVGFDPGTIYSPIDSREDGRPVFGVLRLTPYRITLSGFPDPVSIWTPE
jgi:general stress protein 26